MPSIGVNLVEKLRYFWDVGRLEKVKGVNRGCCALGLGLRCDPVETGEVARDEDEVGVWTCVFQR